MHVVNKTVELYLDDLSLKEGKEGSSGEVDCSFTSLDVTGVTGDEEVDCGTDSLDPVSVELFGDEEVYFCGEVGCWKDSGWDSQMVNAKEVIRGGMVKTKDKETESHSDEERVKEVEPGGVPEEYDGRQMRVETNVIFSEAATAEQTASGHVLSFPTQYRPAHYRREQIISATGIPTWFEASEIRLGEGLTSEERQEVSQTVTKQRLILHDSEF